MGERRDVSFHLIGDVLFPAAERRYGEWLRQRVESSSARDRITWHPAAASPEDAMDMIDILVHTSVAPEPFGACLSRPWQATVRSSRSDAVRRPVS